MKKLLDSYLLLVLLLAALFCCAFLTACSILRPFGYYAIELLKMSWDIDGWATAAFISGIVLLPMLAASIWIQVKSGRLFLWRSTKPEFFIVTVLVTVLVAMICYLVRYDRTMHLILRILVLPFAAYILTVFWLARLAAFLQKGSKYRKFSWYKFYMRFPINQPISVFVTGLLLMSPVYLLLDLNTGAYILTIFHFALVTALAEYLSRFSENMAARFEKISEDRLRAERLKTELIANVSHDIKTPVTSIINYADFISREKTENEQLKEYATVIRRKSLRLKSLMEDLIEASKAGTGNIKMTPETIDFGELLGQIIGEFDDQMTGKQLQLIAKIPETPVFIQADGRYLWRVLENIFNNAVKYSMGGTRVYADLTAAGTAAGITAGGDMAAGGMHVFTLKNISKDPLNISADEITEQFVRGDRARYTEGNGLGLYIAKNLTEAMGGRFNININGDLFEVQIGFKSA